MGAIGVYFNAVEASETPVGPFGLGILAWGFILFAGASASVIGQLWWRIYTTEESYKYSLSLDGLKLVQDDEIIRFMLEMSNALDKPLDYKFDGDRYYVEINGIREISHDRGLKGTVLSGRSPGTYRLPEVLKPDNYPCSMLIHFEIIYGHPKRALFRQIREIDVNLFGSKQKVGFNYVYRSEEYKRLRKKLFAF